MAVTLPFLPRGNTQEDFRSAAYAINNILDGKINSKGTLTLVANTSSTDVSDFRCGLDSVVLLSPKTANAAAALTTTFVSDVTKERFTVTHANNTQTDRTFSYVIIG